MPRVALRRTTVVTLAQQQPGGPRAGCCCPKLHEAIELVGKRWSGAIIAVLLDGKPKRFSEIAQCVPQISDRLLSERMKELEARGLVERKVVTGTPARVTYSLTQAGQELGPVFEQLQDWANRWL